MLAVCNLVLVASATILFVVVSSQEVNSTDRTPKAITSNGIEYQYNAIKLENLNKSDRKRLDEFRKRVKGLVSSNDELLLADRFLIKWLQARNMNLNNAEEMFKNTLDWRRRNRMDSILTEDFTRWEKMYPFIIDGVDKDGHPVFLIPGGRYDIRKAMISGEADHLQRYLEKQLEYGSHYGYNLTFTSGKNLDGKGVLIVDLNGFNLRQHVCLPCIPFYVRSILMYEANYPRIIHKLFIINAPTGVQEVFDIVKVAMSEDSRNLIHIYGFNKSEWMPVLLKIIPEDQLPVRYGGTRSVESPQSMTIGGKETS